MSKSTKNKRLSFDNWKCLECEEQPEFERVDFFKHLRDVHHIGGDKKISGTRKMMMHLDGRDYYQTNYDVEIEGLKAANFVRNERAADDMLRFM